MFKNNQKGNVYLFLTIVVVTFLTVGTVIYLNFPEEKEKIQIILPPKDQLKQREVHLGEIMQFLTTPGEKEISEAEMQKLLDGLSRETKKTPEKPSEIQKDILDSLTN